MFHWKYFRKRSKLGEEAPSLIGALGLCSRWYAGGFFVGFLSAGGLSVTRMGFWWMQVVRLHGRAVAAWLCCSLRCFQSALLPLGSHTLYTLSSSYHGPQRGSWARSWPGWYKWVTSYVNPTFVAPHWSSFSTIVLSGVTKHSCQNHLLKSVIFESLPTLLVDRCNKHIPILASGPLVNWNCARFRW